jgi:Holliday junction resolvase-like predicted endonuclease
MNEVSPADRLTENDIVEAVCRYLVTQGFTINQRLTTLQTGDDIVAVRGDEVFCIEAKGATSARHGSARFGVGFDSAQVHVHVAEAVYKAIQVLTRDSGGKRMRAGIALPSNALHRREIGSIESMLRKLGIAVFWVSDLSRIDVSGDVVTSNERT